MAIIRRHDVCRVESIHGVMAEDIVSYRSSVRLDYGNGVLVGLPAHLMRRLQSVLNVAARLIYHLRTRDLSLIHI